MARRGLIFGQPSALGGGDAFKSDGQRCRRAGRFVNTDFPGADGAIGIVTYGGPGFVFNGRKAGPGKALRQPAAQSEGFVRSVTHRRFSRLFTAAEEHLFAVFCRVLHRVKAAALVRAVTERLIGRLSAGAPEIGFSCLNLNRVGRGSGDFGGVSHGVQPFRVQRWFQSSGLSESLGESPRISPSVEHPSPRTVRLA